jgi:hypothetical protein
VPTDIQSGLMQDITPETIAQDAYIYANYTNVRQGTVLSEYAGDTVFYQFPTEFVQQHKNTLYSNGSAEVHK